MLTKQAFAPALSFHCLYPVRTLADGLLSQYANPLLPRNIKQRPRRIRKG
jgi:hypothetical protein